MSRLQSVQPSSTSLLHSAPSCQNNFPYIKSFIGSINFRIKFKLFRMTRSGLCLLRKFQHVFSSLNRCSPNVSCCRPPFPWHMRSLFEVFISLSGEFLLPFRNRAQASLSRGPCHWSFQATLVSVHFFFLCPAKISTAFVFHHIVSL